MSICRSAGNFFLLFSIALIAAAQQGASAAGGLPAAAPNGTQRGVETVVLVTSASHLRRAVREFAAAGIRVIPAAAEYSGPIAVEFDSVVPSAGEGPIGYVDLAERFFGPILAASPDSDVLAFQRAKAQGKLAAAVTGWEAQRASGARLQELTNQTKSNAGRVKSASTKAS